MPVRPETKHLYGPSWRQISQAIKERAGWRCECAGHCGQDHGGRCVELHNERAQWTGPDPLLGAPRRVRVCLTVAHLNHRPDDNRGENLLALCQACHLAHDRDEHARRRSATWARRRTAELNAVQQLALIAAPCKAAPASSRPSAEVAGLYHLETLGQLRLTDLVLL